MSLDFEITPREVKAKLDAGEALALIDVREASEHRVASIAGAELIPMGSVPQNLPRLEAEADSKLLVVFCHHGIRSLSAVDWLRRHGIENCQSMSGGIDAWSAGVDPKIARY